MTLSGSRAVCVEDRLEWLDHAAPVPVEGASSVHRPRRVTRRGPRDEGRYFGDRPTHSRAFRTIDTTVRRCDHIVDAHSRLR